MSACTEAGTESKKIAISGGQCPGQQMRWPQPYRQREHQPAESAASQLVGGASGSVSGRTQGTSSRPNVGISIVTCLSREKQLMEGSQERRGT